MSVDPVAVQPKAFCLAVGGYPTGTSVVVWRRGVVRYVPPMSKIGDADNRLIVPTAEECAAFARVLRRIRVCDWDERYEFPEICDGTQWRLLVDWPGLARVRARGSNEYPPRFGVLLKAVGALTRGAFAEQI
ncbi:MAG: hypothetical protein U1F08_07020 [Steroidobacteraceae bacterium]